MLDFFAVLTKYQFFVVEKAGAILQSLPRCLPSGRRKTRSVWTVRGAPADPYVTSVHLVGYRENISRGPTFGDFVTEGSMQDLRLHDYRVQEYRLPSPLSIKCNVLRESLSEDSQNIPRVARKRRGSWVVHVHHLCFRSVRKVFYLHFLSLNGLGSGKDSFTGPLKLLHRHPTIPSMAT